MYSSISFNDENLLFNLFYRYVLSSYLYIFQGGFQKIQWLLFSWSLQPSKRKISGPIELDFKSKGRKRVPWEHVTIKTAGEKGCVGAGC